MVLPLGHSRIWLATCFTVLLFTLQAPGQQPAQDLKTAAEEADRLDPGWRWADLMKQRPVVRDEENAVFVLREVSELLPKDRKWEYLDGWFGSINTSPLSERIAPINVEFFQKELDKVQPAIKATRKFSKCKVGRYPGEYTPKFDSTKQPDFPNYKDVGRVFPLVEAEGTLLLNEGKTAEALTNLRALFVIANCADDNPMLIGYLLCIGRQQVALRFLERFLARAELNEEILADLQKFVREERLKPRLLRAMRCERALLYEHCLSLKPSDFPMPEPAGWWQVLRWQSLAHQSHMQNVAHALRYYTAFIEWLKEPTPPREKRLQQLEEAGEIEAEKARKEDASVRPWSFLTAISSRKDNKMMVAVHRHQTLLGCAELAIAIERYRLRHGNWPSALTDIPKEILKEIPPDPYLPGHTLRMSRTPYRSVVYSVGLDQEDNDGMLLKGPQMPGTDLGMTLWSDTIKGPKGKQAK